MCLGNCNAPSKTPAPPFSRQLRPVDGDAELSQRPDGVALDVVVEVEIGKIRAQLGFSDWSFVSIVLVDADAIKRSGARAKAFAGSAARDLLDICRKQAFQHFVDLELR